jgi:hypothetical protein
MITTSLNNKLKKMEHEFKYRFPRCQILVLQPAKINSKVALPLEIPYYATSQVRNVTVHVPLMIMN